MPDVIDNPANVSTVLPDGSTTALQPDPGADGTRPAEDAGRHDEYQARQTIEKSWDETTIYQSEKSSGLSFARKGGGGGVWAIATDNSLHGRHQEATRLWDLVGDLSRSEKTEAFTDWASDTNARIDWTRPAQASTALMTK